MLLPLSTSLSLSQLKRANSRLEIPGGLSFVRSFRGGGELAAKKRLLGFAFLHNGDDFNARRETRWHPPPLPPRRVVPSSSSPSGLSRTERASPLPF